MASRVYTIVGDNITVTGSLSLVFMNPAAIAGSSGFEVLRAWISQRANATSAQIGCALGHKASTFPTLTSATPLKTSPNDPTANITGNTTGAAGTCGINSSTDGTANHVNVVPDNFNALNGWLWTPSPLETFQFMPACASGFFNRMTSTPATLTGWSFGVTYRELG